MRRAFRRSYSPTPLHSYVRKGCRRSRTPVRRSGAQSVRAAVEVLGAQRIGHGIHALRDRDVVDLLARRQIPLEICPTSNARTGAALPDYPHPYVDLDRAGCVVTIDADDPTLFGTSIGREYALVEQVVGENTLTRYVRNAIDASFASRRTQTDHALALGRGTRRAASNVERTCPGIAISPNRSRSISKRSTASSGRARASPPPVSPLPWASRRHRFRACSRSSNATATLNTSPAVRSSLRRSGLEVAVRVLRRHRLAERLLTDVLGMPWDEVHEEACMLEHAISDRVEQRLMTLLNNPETCPHGHPIPPKDLSDPKRIGMPLAQVEAGRQTAVVGVTEEVPEILRYLGQVGLRPGANVHVIEKAPLGGPMTVENENGRHAISLELARMVMVAEPA